MNIPITDKSEFWNTSPAANEIFTYVREEPEISKSPWGFDRGNVSEDLNTTWASFSCRAVSGWGDDKLTVKATKQADGSWSLSHEVQRAT